MKEFIIQFSSLKSGNYTYSFELKTPFFEYLNSEEIKGGDIHLVLDLEKSDLLLSFTFQIKGFIEVLCDRCLEKMSLPVDTLHKLYFKFGESYQEMDDEIIVLPEKEHLIDLLPFIEDYMIMSVPLQKTHDVAQGGKCTEEMLAYIVTEEKNTEIDPRWEKLFALKN